MHTLGAAAMTWPWRTFGRPRCFPAPQTALRPLARGRPCQASCHGPRQGESMRLLRDLFTALRQAKQQYEAAHPPLHDAALAGDAKRVRRLIGEGADVNAHSARGWTALHWAVHSGAASVVALLLENGAEADAVDEDGKTPLHHAAEG